MDAEIHATKEGVKLFSKLVVAAADDDMPTTLALMADVPPRILDAVVLIATKLVAEEVPLTRVASLLATAEDYEGTVGE